MLRSLSSLMLFLNLNGSSEVLPADDFDILPSTAIELSPIPELKDRKVAPLIQAKAALLMDNATGLVLYEKKAHEPLPMASLTKIMTAILILENHGLDEVVEIPENYKDLEGVKIFLHAGEQMTVKNLLEALLIPSAGDAAMALAVFHSGSVEAFVEAMNQRAQELELHETVFKNPVGLDEAGHVSSAYDLAQMARYAMNIPAFRDIVKIQNTSISSVDGRFSYRLKNTNELLGSYLNVVGVKTGTTDEAGQSLVNLARNDAGREVVAVILNSPDRFQENKSMLDWAFRSYLW